MTNEEATTTPLARAVLRGVRASQIAPGDIEETLTSGLRHLLNHGVSGSTPGVLRFVAAYCETVALLKEEAALKQEAA